MRSTSLFKWTLLNAFGLGIGFVLYLQLGMIIEYGFDIEKYWKFIPPSQSIWSYLSIPFTALFLGIVVGFFQSLVIKEKGIKSISWITITAIGFGLITLLDIPLLYFEILGKIPGPVEPIIVTIGGSIFAGMVQYYWLKKQQIKVGIWLLLWTLGAILSLIPLYIIFSFLAPAWPMEVFINGFIVGGTAALLSGTKFFKAFKQ